MKKVLLITIAISLFLLPASAVCGDWTGDVNLFMGAKQLDEDDWEPVDEHDEYGIMLDFRHKSWPVSIAIDFLSSSDEETVYAYISGYGTLPFDVEGKTRELNLGIRKIWDRLTPFRPYIGGGLAMVSAEAKGSVFGYSVSDDDNAIGFWFGGGFYLTLSEHFNLGLDIRLSRAEVTIAGVDGEAGGTHAGLVLGYHW
jgi:opacity protein-like surface antigen